MRWLRQQRKVDALSAQASGRTRQAARLRLAIGYWCKRSLQQPATLAWAFAAGTLVGVGADTKKARRAQDLLKWVNFTTVVWGLLTQERQLVQKGQKPGPRWSPTRSNEQGIT